MKTPASSFSSTSLPPSARGHLLRLDALRGVAILMVFGYHLLGPTWDAFDLPWAGTHRDALTRTLAGVPPQFLWVSPLTLGWAGVSLFLVLSGFVIHYTSLPLLNERGQVQLGDFFRRRFFRIYPAYFVALVVFTLLDVDHLWGKGLAKVALHVVTHLFFLHTLSSGTFFSISGVFWSLALEVQLYALYPLLLWLRARRGMTGALAVTFVVALLARAVLAIGQDWHGELQPIGWQSAPVLWFDWTLGALLAERFRRGDGPVWVPRWALPCCGILAVASLGTKPTYAVSFTLASLFFALLVDRQIRNPRPLGRVARLLTFVGTVSYSLYLWHGPLVRLLLKPVVTGLVPLVGTHAAPLLTLFVGGPVALGICLTIAWLSYRILELTGVQLGKRLQQASRR